MPHLVLQHSANLKTANLQKACDALHEAMVMTGIFPLGGIRVRALACEAYAIADKHPQNAFVDLVLRMAKGRTDAQKKSAGEEIMRVAERVFATELSQPHFSLALEVVEIDETLSWKANSIHARLKAKT